MGCNCTSFGNPEFWVLGWELETEQSEIIYATGSVEGYKPGLCVLLSWLAKLKKLIKKGKHG
jgi:hypothetical protein